MNSASTETATTAAGATSPVPEASRMAAYSVPASVVLSGLGISPPDLGRSEVTVSGAYLSFLLTQIANAMPVDPIFYAEHYPDVQAAVEAGRLPSLSWHFAHTGWLEGRLPCAMAFDPAWYGSYRDLVQLRGDADGLQKHFVHTGYKEGRAGTADTAVTADSWRHGVDADEKNCGSHLRLVFANDPQ